MIEIHSPYGGNFDMDVIEPGTSSRRAVQFLDGVARLEADDPLVPLFRNLAERHTTSRPARNSYTVTDAAAVTA